MRRTPLTLVPLTLALLAALVLTAGGCAFDRSWRSLARADAAPAAAGDALAGRWEGKWVSEANGHAGRLRAIITPVDATTYRVRYDATYLGLLRFGYGMDLQAAPQPDGVIGFQGEENLGALAGGVYRYNGSADGETFASTYQSSADRGRFEMRRPRQGK